MTRSTLRAWALALSCATVALALGRPRPAPPPPRALAAASITPITSPSDAKSGIVFSGNRYDVSCTVSGSVTLYPAGHNGTAWTVYYGYPCALDGSVATKATCPFPSNGNSAWTWNAYKTGGGSVSSCTAEPVSAPLARRGGGASCPTCPTYARVAPDADDLIVLYDYEGGTWANAGSGSGLDFDVYGSVSPTIGMGAFREGIFLPVPLDSDSSGGIAYSANTTEGQAQILSVSNWAWISSLPEGAVAHLISAKKYQALGSGWASKYVTWGFFLTSDGSVFFAASTSTLASQPIVTSATGSVTPGLHHFAITVDGDRLFTAYQDGDPVGSDTLDSDLSYNGGPYILGGIPISGAASATYSAAGIGDFRVAPGVVRSAAHYAAVWATAPQVSALAAQERPRAAEVRPASGESWAWAQSQTVGTALRRAAWPAGEAVARQTDGTWRVAAPSWATWMPWRPSQADRDGQDWSVAA